MSWLKATRIETGEVTGDSRLDDMNAVDREYVSIFDKYLAGATDPQLKENLTKIRESAIRRIHSGNPKGVGSAVEPGDF